jgi:tetraacyldisaccharide 4'-kinase
VHTTSLMRRLASLLEQGALGSFREEHDGHATQFRPATLDYHRFAIAPLAGAVARAWEAVADPVRATRLPAGASVVGIGGATLGGAGKTPLTLALAQALARRGSRVAVVASGYRCRLSAARHIRPDDRASIVGDEALWLCRALWAERVHVVCGPRRDEALEVAAEVGGLIVVDGLLQARPQRLDLSVLVLDGARPWGAARCPPAGDLRARPDRLLAAADLVVVCQPTRRVAAAHMNVGQPTCRVAAAHMNVAQPTRRMAAAQVTPLPCATPLYHSQSELLGARTPRGEPISIDELRSMRLGLLLAVARPDRVLEALTENGIVPCAVRLFGDHSPMTRMAMRRADPSPDAWLTTAKCATKLAERLAGAPVLTLEHRVAVPEALLARCLSLR